MTDILQRSWNRPIRVCGYGLMLCGFIPAGLIEWFTHNPVLPDILQYSLLALALLGYTLITLDVVILWAANYEAPRGNIRYTTVPRKDGKNCGNCIETQRDDFGGACCYAGEIGNHYCDMWQEQTK